MMTKTTTFLAMSLLLIFSSCKENKSKPVAGQQASEQNSENLKIDSLEFKDSAQLFSNVKIDYKSKVLLFPDWKGKKMLDSIYFKYKGLKDFSREELQKAMENEKNMYYADLKKQNEEDKSMPESLWMADSKMKIKSNENGFLHMEYSMESNNGGPYSNEVFQDKVFDLKNDKKVELSDITSLAKTDIEKLLKQNAAKITFKNEGSEKPIILSEELYDTNSKLTLNNFYFDQKNLYFHYSPGEVAIHALGNIVIPISWEELKGKLNPEFQNRMK
ncbi:RsiV family protein [Chryseobacterium daeguense]|uniref:RsiV family protein n=1 Tax=Chryseobacterium daeguense TaxID=412438 RepID=UPI00138B1AF3|nr:RsiV family protein [Chryseobacterium daeguense]